MIGPALRCRSVPIAFLIAAVLTVGMMLPKIIICGVVRVRGGEYTLVVFCTACAIFNIYLNVTQLSVPLVLGNVAMLVISIIYAQLRLPKVTMDPSYEEIVDG